MRRRIMGAGLVALTMVPAAARAEFDRYVIDPAHISIGFTADHLGYGSVLGLFLEGAGSFEFDRDAPAVRAIEVEVAAGSVFTNHDARDGHLRSDDFLDADAHPVIRFTGHRVEQTGDATGIAHGELTIRGVTRPAQFEVTLNKAADYPFGAGPPFVVGVTVRGTILRSDFGSTYGVANGWVGDEIHLTVAFEAIRQD